MTMKVAQYRRLIDSALNHTSYNFQSCVNSGELENWIVIAESYIERLQGAICKRANETDKREYAYSIEQLNSCLVKAKEDIKTGAREAYTARLSKLNRERRLNQ